MKTAALHLFLAPLFCCTLIGSAVRASAQGGVPLWTNRYDSGSFEAPNAIGTDTDGNIFVAGFSADATSGDDYLTIKYSNSGMPLWTNRFSSAGNYDDIANALAVDRNGNVFVTGYSHNGNGNLEYSTIKYSGEGVAIWTNRYNEGTNVAAARAIVLDSTGNVFVTGSLNGEYATVAYSNSGIPLWTNRTGNSASGSAIAIAVDTAGNVFVTGQASVAGSPLVYRTIKYSNGGLPLWTNLYGSPNGGAEVNAMALDRNGNVFVTGASSGDFATVAYSNAGVALWTNRYDGGFYEVANAITVDDNGNVFVTGSVGADYTTIKYSNLGVPLWTNHYNGPALDDLPTAIAVDSSGNVFVTGLSPDSCCLPRVISFATIAYSSAGDLLWENRYHSVNESQAWAIAVDSSGNVFVTGLSSNGSSYDFVTIKYSSSLPIYLEFQSLNNQLVLSWTNVGFNLQSAPTVSGTFTNIPSATSPYSNSLSGPRQFFRLISN